MRSLTKKMPSKVGMKASRGGRCMRVNGAVTQKAKSKPQRRRALTLAGPESEVWLSARTLVRPMSRLLPKSSPHSRAGFGGGRLTEPCWPLDGSVLASAHGETVAETLDCHIDD